jgi:hypothetical protein
MVLTEQVVATRREYSVRPAIKLGDAFLACFFVLGSGFIFLHWALHPALSASLADEWYGLFLIFFGFSIGIPALVDLTALRLVLDGPKIEVRRLLSIRVAEIREIEGLRSFSADFFSCFVLYMKDKRAPIEITGVFNTDDYFRQWLKQIPDLDERDRERRANEKAAQSGKARGNGASIDPEDRARHIYVSLYIPSVLAVAELWWGPSDFWLCSEAVLVLLPVAVWLLLRQQPIYFALCKKRPDDRYELVYILWFCFIGGLLQVGKLDGHTHFVSLWLPLLVTACIAVACILAFAHCAAHARHPLIVASFLATGCLPFAYAAAFDFDIIPDHSIPMTYALPVSPSQITGDGQEHAELLLPPWGPVRTPARLRLNVSASRQILSSGQVCLSLRPGFLMMPWYEAKPCSNHRAPLAH